MKRSQAEGEGSDGSEPGAEVGRKDLLSGYYETSTLESQDSPRLGLRGTSGFSGLRETMFAGVPCASRDATELGQTHCGAEWRHSPVSSTDGQVVEGNGLPVQFDILSDPQHTLHRRDHKLPWKPPGQAGVSGWVLPLSSLPLAILRISGAAETYVILGPLWA